MISAWNNGRWVNNNPFKNLPESGKPIKKIYIENGKLKIEYEDLAPEGEESEEP